MFSMLVDFVNLLLAALMVGSNAVVMTWHTGSPPANWMSFRDQWWRWHLIRLAAGIWGLSLLIAAMLTPRVG